MALGILSRTGLSLSTVLAALALLQTASPQPASNEERLARHRNLGKAFYENPTTQQQSVDEFKKALELAPNSARERLNYALALLAAGSTQDGIAELEKVQKQDPKLPHTWFNLGIQYKKQGDYERAARQFEGMLQRVPDEPVSHYNLGTLHKLAGRNEEAVRAFETASRLDPNLAAPHFQLFNMYRQLGRREDSQRRLETFQLLKKQQESAAVPEDMEWSFYSEIYDPVDEKAAIADQAAPARVRFSARTLAPAVNTDGAQLAALDYNGDLRPDLLAVAGGKARLLNGGTAAVSDAALGSADGVLHAAPGDVNNDAFPDVCLITAKGPVLLTNNKGRFARTPLPAPPGNYRIAVWLDYDHDYDLDLILLGDSAALLRNQGQAGFADRTGDIPFVREPVISAAAFRVIPDTKGIDLLVTYKNRPAVLYRDKLGGKFEAQPVPAIPAGAALLQVADADHNGSIDALYAWNGKAHLAANRGGSFSTADTGAPAPAILVDVENRAVQDLVSPTGIARTGTGRPPGAVPGLPAAALAYAAADFTGDGKQDLVAAAPDGSVTLLTNQTATTNRWMRVALTGVKNNKLAHGAEVEVKAGVRYQKQIYRGAPLTFGLSSYAEADTVRITWPNGLIQSEARQLTARTHNYKEAQRLSGSCPQVFTWNGRQFVYVTDILGVAPLGAAAGDGAYFPTDRQEHIQIPAGLLAPRDGKYEIRLTEELAEVAYIDRAQLIAVDHPRDSVIFINEKFQSPPYPDLKVYTVRRPVPIPLTQVPGATEFTVSADGLLILTGWVDWPDGSTFLAKSQEGAPLTPPSLEMQQRDGSWRRLIEDIGLPAGKPKSIVVELPSSLPRPARLRIVTNTPVHWTAAALAQPLAAVARLHYAAPAHGELRFRGFSRVRIHPERLEPERFFYDQPLNSSMWNPTPGLYTRYGEVNSLLGSADDSFVIMGSGDELSLRFDAAAFPPVPPGHARSFLLAVDGWAKDRDPNTAHSQTVEPLPFREMSGYPYPAGERLPDSELHRRYNVRPAVRSLRPLNE